MALDFESCEQASSFPLDSMTTTGREDTVDASPTQSLAIAVCLTGLGDVHPMALRFSYKNKKGRCLQLCQKSYDLLCQGHQLIFFRS